MDDVRLGSYLALYWMLAGHHADAVALAVELMEKNPEVLRATKHALRAVRTMNDDQAFDYLAAKASEIKLRDKENAYHHGIKQFVDDKTYKPTFSAYDRERASQD